MSENIERRRFLKGIGAASLILGPMGCTSVKDDNEDANKPHYVMVFDQNKCVGCGECKEACNVANNLPDGKSRMLMEHQSGGVEGQACPHCGKEECNCERKFVRVSCQQCKNAPCVSVCPTGAAHKDPKTGIVTMDASKCAGCKYCIGACPYNARFINEETDVADNCDFCLNSKLSKGELPACVQQCKYDALIFGDANDPTSYVNKLLAVKDSVRMKPQFGTEPSLRYIPVVKLGV
ncbi:MULTISPECIES: 4Fe-4S dicluster domain-containing protein [Shewanella]|uniref:4Fe-4S dicluster domain-containing protein n=1 Tax=Shewanella electrodiphila TaxID=934143 RepID=A0ABT0KW28_9GAMM|nr:MULTISPECIES: 4Fe-4S dicluster domain-containing protein [unclassified Shewanella]MCL1047834.1 4Fe-4S dicluster domain-containing protein [Shewanella electrodiphila]MDO6619394.1 4Fe-4S dicluster domain-containing protein [Shewanella sp. 6_MG-2023]MDO6775313.1 4Fe-4S dicluster domain-containing protein [Shewanella sp. 3_MG-2023]PMG30612.1 nitrite reductase [Shewanella sp. 10N.286.52.C2]PMG50076.1 nitrite reductase [Shewanella sp. 10N.286.52.B9]